MDLRIGDIVGRKSYGCDIIFKVHDILMKDQNYVFILKGVNLRILADSPERDIVKLSVSKIEEEDNYFIKKRKKIEAYKRKTFKNAESKIGNIFKNKRSNQIFMKPGKVLHLDGDSAYLEMCMKYYKENSIEAVGKTVPEIEQSKRVVDLLKKNTPDILVLTGHDAMLKKNRKDKKNIDKLSDYRNSKYYIQAVREARIYESSLDDLVIFAGACQSYFEGIIGSGANFASSPERILIHALDPVMICKSIAYTPINNISPLEETLKNTISGLKGIGGVETRGKYRDGMPKIPYKIM